MEHESGIDEALVEALAGVVHVGDYGTLWINEAERYVHLTMGDADGDVDRGLTGFDEIRRLTTAAVAPFWPGWTAGDSVYGGIDGGMEIADEWDPVGGAWRAVGSIGKVT